jgi:RNA polymerase sigma-B factor
MMVRSGETNDKTRQRLIESHLPLVRSVARRYAGRGETMDDLVQVGAVGLIKASDRFDSSRGVAFATFAAPAIEGEIRRHLGDRTQSLRIPRELQRMSGQLRRCRADLTASLGRLPATAELAAELGVEEGDIERALEAERAAESVPLADEDGAEGAEPLAGTDARLAVGRALRVLDKRERRIVFLRFHADMTERQIAGALGISQSHVSRLLGGALAKLREELGDHDEPDGISEVTTKEVIPREDAPSAAEHGTESRLQHAQNQVAAENRIEPMRVSAKNPQTARYLSLPYHVTVRSERTDEGSFWWAAVEELAGCEARGATADEAIEHLRPAMEAWISAALAEGRAIPEPSQQLSKPRAAPAHSGRFLVRMSGELHEELARAAEREQVSLNRLVTDVLSAYVEPGPLAHPTPTTNSNSVAVDPTSDTYRGRARAFRIALATNLIVVVVAGLAAIGLLVLAAERGF